MPELPEVETIKRQLKKNLVGKKVLDVKINLAKMVNLPIKIFVSKVIGAKILDVKRRAKILIFDLDNHWHILVHLKMTGQLVLSIEQETDLSDRRHSHIVYHFDDQTKLYHNDLRQFGWEKLLTSQELAAYWQKEKLGPEPLDKDFTLKLLTEILAVRPRSLIKPLLMDQKAVSGIGNIYADEILFVAGVLPTRRAENLTKLEIKQIYQAIKEILKKALDKHGTSVDNYRDAFGRRGGYIPYLLVYSREGQACNGCGGKVMRQKLRGRSAHYCPKCQV